MLLLLPVAAVRGLLLVLTLLLFALVSAIATAGADETSQLAPWRRSIVLHSRILGRLVLVFLGFWVNVDGWDNYMQAQRCGVVRSRPLAGVVSDCPCGTSRLRASYVEFRKYPRSLCSMLQMSILVRMN